MKRFIPFGAVALVVLMIAPAFATEVLQNGGSRSRCGA